MKCVDFVSPRSEKRSELFGFVRICVRRICDVRGARVINLRFSVRQSASRDKALSDTQSDGIQIIRIKLCVIIVETKQ